jgi:hypothetical protein
MIHKDIIYYADEENGMNIVSQKEFQFPTVTDCISFFRKK